MSIAFDARGKFATRFPNPPYTKDIPVQRLREHNREQLQFVLDWHKQELAKCHPRNDAMSRSIPRHQQIIRDLEGELNL